MCHYEIINFIRCGHQDKRLTRYCHFARNDPNHQCFSPWQIEREWDHPKIECDKCSDQKLKLRSLANGEDWK
ncbi:hypothetical protein K505DRAFT_250649 [Melanomma pulvis-pyrius CBS 109.77]|uniref:Uncharacterized protein n=1 Tax=Melanomma pulvis-pyrius CBS 109.77 TaxID=1314802 RepID=A0A6A6X2E4_9PLEO|nr:hypothetical protein K505DRAFT_250649 [Melanomma pulvis-pyrius CBS 109.77]